MDNWGKEGQMDKYTTLNNEIDNLYKLLHISGYTQKGPTKKALSRFLK